MKSDYWDYDDYCYECIGYGGEDIWRWFESEFDVSVHDLMYCIDDFC